MRRLKYCGTLVLLLAASSQVTADETSLPKFAVGRLGSERFQDPVVILDFQLSPDGKLVAVCGAGGGVRLLQTEGGETEYTLPIGDWYKKVRFAPDGQTIATLSHKGIIDLWDYRNGVRRDRHDATAHANELRVAR